MKKYAHSLFIALLVSSFSSFAQNKGDEYAVLYREANSLLVAAYEKRDTAAYTKQFAIIQREYNKLSAKDRAKYRSTINDAWYNLACTYALVGDKRKALSSLEKSHYYDYNHLLNDDDLTALLGEPRFARFAKVARKNSPNYVATLRNAPRYNASERKDLPAFTYESSYNKRLEKLRIKYKLDSIAGYGTDISRMINLMRWVHNIIQHDGSKGNPEKKNALSLIKTCRKEGKTLNCRGMATVLNEVYLACDIPSRIVTCMPKDPNDNDCHVIVTAWSATKRKWVWMDPTFMAYVMDEKGNMLGIEEVRQRLISGKPLVLNADANHNGKETQTKEYYLQTYMAKNLYKLECPASSEYDYETLAKGKERTYIQLTPGGSAMKSGTSARYDGMNTYHKHYTANPNRFWQVPPGQSRADFDKAMAAFMKNCNSLDDEAINTDFSHLWDEFAVKLKHPIWPAGRSEAFVKEYGKIRSFKYLGVAEDGVTIYKVVCDKSTHALGISLDYEGKYATFRPWTSSPAIKEMMIDSF
jgi:hypothetical protein